ncbi:MAG: tetratricopeptide repeat protein [Phycisphaerae bacterium]|nr:tetratricopeptide repeat protein [Phycisphaerae bacterium]
MARVRINWKLIVVLFIAVVVLAVAAVGLRQWNRGQRAGKGLNLGLAAYDAKDWDAAASNLGRYLGVAGDDAEILNKYAESQLRRRPAKGPNINQAINAYRRVLRLDEDPELDAVRREAAVQLIGLYLQMNIASEAELIATQQLEKGSDHEIRRMLATAYMKQRKFPEAAKELGAIIKDDPSAVTAYGLMAELAEQRPQDMPQGAEYWYNEAIRNNPESAHALLLRGLYFLAKDRNKDALADFEAAQGKDVSEMRIRLALAEGFLKAGQVEQAETHLAAARAQDPSSLGLWMTWANLALRSQSTDKIRQIADEGLASLTSEVLSFMPVATELYVRTGDYEKAADCIERLRKGDGESSMIAFLEGLLAEQQGLWADALARYRQATDLGMQSEQVQLRMASALVRLGDRVSAIAQLRSMVNKNENAYRARALLARLLADNGRYTEAAEHGRTLALQRPALVEGHLIHLQAQIRRLAAEKTPADSTAWDTVENDLKRLDESVEDVMGVKVMRVYAAMQRGRLDKAAEIVADLKTQYPKETQPRLIEIEVLVAGKQTAEAMTALDGVMRDFPQSMLAVSYMVNLLAGEGDYEQCRTVLTSALSRAQRPEDVRSLNLLLADVYARTNSIEKATELMHTVSQQLPNDVPVMRKLLTYRRTLGQTDGLQALIDRIKTVEGPQGWQWRYEQAALWFALDAAAFDQEWPQAVALLRENIAANPEDQMSRRLLAACYERAGRQHLAISVYTQALERAPGDVDVIVPAVAMLYRAQRYEQADAILDRAVRSNAVNAADDRLSRLMLSRHEREGEYDSAGALLENLLSGDPDNKDDRFTLALIRMLQNDHQKARELLGQLRVQDADYMPAAAGLVELSIREDKREEALKLCDEMIGRLNSAAAYILRSRAYVRLAEFDKAKADMDRAIGMEPENARNMQLKAEFHRTIGELDEAIAAADKALAMVPDDFSAQKQMVFLLLAAPDKARMERGRLLMEKALQARSEDGDLLVAKATMLMQQGTAPALDESERTLRGVVRLNPANERAWALLATVYLNRNDLAKSFDAATEGLMHLPQNRTLMMIKAHIEAARSPELALGTLRQLAREHPDDVQIAIDLAMTQVQAGQSQEAIQFLEQRLASTAEANRRRLDIALAVALYESGRMPEAGQKFDALYAAAPDDASIVVAHTQVLGKRKAWSELTAVAVDWCGRHLDAAGVVNTIVQGLITNEDAPDEAKKTAEGILTQVLAVNARSVEALNTMALLMHMQGRTTEAATYYQKVLDIEPERLVVLNNLAWILCEEQKQYAKARQLVNQGLAVNPNYIDLIDTSGMIYLRTGEYDKAAAEFNKCLKLYPQHAPGRAGSLLHLAQTYEKMGRKQEAIDHVRKAIEHGGLGGEDLKAAEALLDRLVN